MASALILWSAAYAGVVEDVRAAIAAGDLARGAGIAEAYRARQGATPELAEAVSWLGRAALSSKRLDDAARYAAEARRITEGLIKARPLDSDSRLATAMGASIEVEAQTLAARGQRGQAVALLRAELKRWNASSIRARVQKNLNLLTLEGRPAPPLDAGRLIEGTRVPLVHGKPMLIFLWAHWCGDCKAEAAVLAQIRADYGDALRMVAPTQLYGYVGGGEEAPPAAETKYIAEVWRKYYAPLAGMPVVLSAVNFQRYGVSTTPTIVIVDASGIVRLYHPGAMSLQEMRPYLDRAVRARAYSSR